LWADYVDPARSDYIVDDLGGRGGLPRGTHFVIAGDLNADPVDGESTANAACQLTDHALLQDPLPSSEGAKQADGGARPGHGDPETDTADFGEVGNLRVDYVLPSRTLKVVDSGVFWPQEDGDGRSLIQQSDHRLVWVDVEF
jgi:endonuclease/exonuclease/phosphatase family metal-dependent hydrolase